MEMTVGSLYIQSFCVCSYAVIVYIQVRLVAAICVQESGRDSKVYSPFLPRPLKLRKREACDLAPVPVVNPNEVTCGNLHEKDCEMDDSKGIIQA